MLPPDSGTGRSYSQIEEEQTGKDILKVDGVFMTMRSRMIMLKASDKQLVAVMQKKMWNLRSNFQVALVMLTQISIAVQVTLITWIPQSFIRYTGRSEIATGRSRLKATTAKTCTRITFT